MLTFGIDTCCAAATAAIINDDVLLAQTVINNGKTHSQKMMPQIEAMLSFVGIDPNEIDLYAAAVGPGSFTGVRIGVATAKAMAQAANKPCAAVSTLEALAFASKHFDGVICPILDARRSQVYNALFENENGELKRRCADRALALKELFCELEALGKNVLFMGDGTLVYKTEIKSRLGIRAFFAPKLTNLNLAGAVAELGERDFLQGKTVSYAELVPQYVRLSQAEQEKLRQKENTEKNTND